MFGEVANLVFSNGSPGPQGPGLKDWCGCSTMRDNTQHARIAMHHSCILPQASKFQK